MSNSPEYNPSQPNEQSSLKNRWSYLNQYEKKYLKEAMKSYDEIMSLTDDISKIANRYSLNYNDVERAKNYAFGNGVEQNKFIPDLRMAQAWERMASAQEIDIDEVLLRHEICESELVINQGMNQLDSHKIAQEQYPWSILIHQKEKGK